MTHPANTRHSNGRNSTLDHARPTRHRWRAWTNHAPALAGLSWQRFRGELRHSTADRQDELLAALAHIAHRDPAAIDVLVACLTPGLRARIARHAPGLPPDDAWAIAAAGICAAATGPDPPTSLVASRLLDAAKRHLQRAVRGEVAWHRQANALPVREDAGHDGELSGGLILASAVSAGVLRRHDAWLIYTTRVVGHSLGYAARRLGLGYEATKKRRQRAEDRWATWWADDAESADARRGVA
ncbi:MAG: hypothetical protein ACRD2C_17740 [Acidimicrobiales bacterium]